MNEFNEPSGIEAILNIASHIYLNILQYINCINKLQLNILRLTWTVITILNESFFDQSRKKLHQLSDKLSSAS